MDEQRVTRLIRRVTPWGLGGIVAIASLSSPGVTPVQTMSEYSGSDVIYPLLFTGAALAGLTAGLARRWIWPLAVVATLGWCLLTMFPVVGVLSYYVALRLSRWPHIFAYLAAAATAVVVPTAFGIAHTDDLGTGSLVGMAVYGLMVGLPFAVGFAVRARRQVFAALEDKAARLEREQATRAEQARVEERARIAREMHDVVAHRVALMVLHAGAIEVNTADEKLSTEAALIRTTGREALTELRQVLGVLRTEDTGDLAPQPDLSDLERLLDQTRAAGVNVTYTQTGEARPLPLVVQRTAYRLVQEALTNVVKHSGGADTRVSMHYLGSSVELKVDNEPARSGAERLPGSGLGLIGLRERVALLYGRFEARPRLDGGFTVTAFLPGEA
ncbi:sensor histidine kinase [Catelliglobosispora koreensis]|uniref:sensor histidine kinase n=1 Tax=Catelliglobosispora koreensis TaxID=129052 RepID=UPI000360603E|nr:histidine kinase [Catelliglobosispora koreensis]